MALFRNLGVNLQDCLCDVPMYVSAQSLDFLDLAKKYSFLNWKLTLVPTIQRFIYGWALRAHRLSPLKIPLLASGFSAILKNVSWLHELES